MTTDPEPADIRIRDTPTRLKDGMKTVLIVDDQADERAIQRAMLEHVGYRVTEAEDGQQALDLARAMLPDLVLLDIAMPHMDGITVCERLRSDPLTSSTMVLFYTASPVAGLEERVRAVGASGVLIKPVEPQEVAKHVRMLIGPPDS